MSPLPPSRFKVVYFLYDSYSEATHAIEEVVRTAYPNIRFLDLYVPSPTTQIEEWRAHLQPLLIPNALLIGIGRAGTAAASIQEQFSDLDLSVVAINSPTEGPSFTIERRHKNRVALFSSDYPPIKGLTKNWSLFSEISFDVSWLQHGILSESGGNLCKHSSAFLIITYMKFARESEFVSAFSRIKDEVLA